MQAIIEHFEKYPLITKKWADYQLFKKASHLILNKQHLSISGLNKLVSLKASINKGLSDHLRVAFSNLTPVNREKVVNSGIPNPYWLAGFTSGEGSFLVRVFKSSNHQTGYQVQLRFQITQQSRDKALMEMFVKYLGCGFISTRGDIVDYHVVKFTDIIEKIIPFFAKAQIVGVKNLNYEDFTKVAYLIKNKDHLTMEGLEKIKEIKSNMNDSREINTND